MLVLFVVVNICGCTSGAGDGSGNVVSAVEAKQNAVLARLVFIDQENCCQCTRDRIESSWAALESVNASVGGLPVERIHKDTESELAAIYVDRRPVMVIPGIYFIGSDNNILELLQGEVRTDQIEAALRKHKQ